MLEFANIVDAVHGLSHQEKLKLRLLLDKELKSADVPVASGANSKSGLIGLFVDEPELMDEVMESVYEHRVRPLRLDD